MKRDFCFYAYGKSLQNEMDDFIRIIRSIQEHFFRMTLTQKSVSSNCTIQVLSDSFLKIIIMKLMHWSTRIK